MSDTAAPSRPALIPTSSRAIMKKMRYWTARASSVLGGKSAFWRRSAKDQRWNGLSRTRSTSAGRFQRVSGFPWIKASCESTFPGTCAKQGAARRPRDRVQSLQGSAPPACVEVRNAQPSHSGCYCAAPVGPAHPSLRPEPANWYARAPSASWGKLRGAPRSVSVLRTAPRDDLVHVRSLSAETERATAAGETGGVSAREVLPVSRRVSSTNRHFCASVDDLGRRSALSDY